MRLEGQLEEVEEVKTEKPQISEADLMQMVMDEINSKTLNIIGSFDDKLVEHVRMFANNVWYYEQDKTRPLYVNITSHGGYACSLFAVLDILQDLKNEWDCTIITNCSGYAESCGFILWCFGDERYMGKYGELMTHYVSYGCQGNPEDHDFELKRTKRMQKKINKIICEKTPLTEQQLNKWYKKGDKFIDYDEAMELGLLTIKEDEEEE